MIYHIELTPQAQSDLLMIVEYYYSQAGSDVAENPLSKLENGIATLAEMPQRGHKPHELFEIASADELEIIIDGYRIIYKIKQQIVYVIAIFDGRQEVKKHLMQRMMKFH